MNFNTNRKDRIKLSIKDKTYDGQLNKYFTESKEILYTSLEETFKSHNYSPIEWKNNERDEKNFISATGFVVDIDNGLTIQQAETILKNHSLNYALITSRSHSDQLHKFHILLPFNRRLHTLENYKTVIQRIKTELFPAVDTNTFDGARFMFGSNDDSIYSSSFTGSDYNVDTEETISDAWNDELELTFKDGVRQTVGNIALKENQTIPIYCPFHDDNSPSAFIGYSEKSFNHYIRCSTCGKTFWKVQSGNVIALKSEKFWSYNTSVYEAGIVGDIFSLENISEKKFYVKVGAVTKEEKTNYFNYLVNNKHLHRLNSINHVGDINSENSGYECDLNTGNITVKLKALPIRVIDNKFIEDYLEGVFGLYKDFIKQWLAVYVYTNYKKLPTIILTGIRGTGKNTFAESIYSIFPTLSETAKELDGSFNPFAEKKLLIIDESASNGKVQYQMLKKFSGQKYLEVNKKYLPQYQVRNNLNIIFLSNDDMPVYVERDEIPTDERNNQFFVFRLKISNQFDPVLQDKITDRLGHYIRTELKTVYESLKLDDCRYSIRVPITEEENKLFNNSVTDVEAEADRIIDEFENNLTNPSWFYYDFVKHGILPSNYFDDAIKSFKVNKIKVVQNLQKRGYIANEKVQRLMQVNGKRPYSYKLGHVWLGMLQNQTPQKVSVGPFTNSHSDSQNIKRADTLQLELTV